MIPQWIIERKRDGKEITEGEIREFISLYASEEIPDYQMAALAMAIYFKGLNNSELTAMTDAMMRSGDVLDFTSLSRPTADKHSTGGVGDKISIPLAPLVASVGVAVPMISGRGLGITGGTLDKLESIPGYNTQLTTEEFYKALENVGCSIIGQTSRLAPADKKLYALRDVTGTVPSIPLISASIMSKKLAEGAGSLVLDVKCGKGAFMKTREDAHNLATTMISIGKSMGRNMAAYITDMNYPLGATAGNTLEIIESIEVLKNAGPADVRELVLALGSEMVVQAKAFDNLEDARLALENSLSSGKALEYFEKMVINQGGDANIVDDYSLMPQAEKELCIFADESGYVNEIDADGVGRMVLLLGGGRTQVTDAIDYGVGVSDIIPRSSHVSKGDLLMKIHYNNAEHIEEVKELARKSVVIEGTKSSDLELIYERLY